jgi:hypothetical protein
MIKDDPSIDDDHLEIILNPADNPKLDPIAGQPIAGQPNIGVFHRKYLKYKMKYLNLLKQLK